MRKLTYASIASICMLPALFWSQDSSAVPAFARKYGTSCFTCHSGFPNRNAFGEAFKNNGYRWPGGEEEDHTKQEQVKMGDLNTLRSSTCCFPSVGLTMGSCLKDY